MSAAYAPEPDERGDRPAPAEPSRDQKILDEIAGYENGADPAFVARLREEPDPVPTPANPATERVIQVLVVAVVAGLLLPTAWVMVGVVFAVIIVVPAMLAWYERRERRARPEPDPS